ncbi:MAG TPA: TIGR03557 family F420-dependent LLM class oxidoreductase, partial [Terriglobia bacterium]|nr:TIGR03557 family F420-dependent LLM class oxidoreductase [Terriglobia bacterium]
SVIGGIAATTKRLRLGTGVTCPTIRIHPAIVAQAAATAAAMMPGRFFLGVGSGENLNEHVVGQKWPSSAVRKEMLEEAVALIRKLWEGENRSHRGRYFTVENACVFTRPKEPPPIYIAAGGRKMAELAARTADGLITAGDEAVVIKHFNSEGGRRKPKYTQITVCWAKTEKEARRVAHEWWPTSAFPWPLLSELPLPQYFEEAAKSITEDEIAEAVVCGPDPDRHIGKIREVAKAGADHVFIHQVGKDQEGFFRFYEREVLPEFGIRARRAA